MQSLPSVLLQRCKTVWSFSELTRAQFTHWSEGWDCTGFARVRFPGGPVTPLGETDPYDRRS
jgi:hypothetical protein